MTLIMYIDPGSLMPVVSAVAAVAGSILMFGRRMARGVRAGVRAVTSKFRRTSS